MNLAFSTRVVAGDVARRPSMQLLPLSQQELSCRGIEMNSLEAVRFEVLRLAKVGGKRVCIRTHQLCGVFNVSESHVRRELAKLAEEKLILLAGWDGREIRDYAPSGEEFINSRLGSGLDTCTSYCPRARQGSRPSPLAATDVGSSVGLLSHFRRYDLESLLMPSHAISISCRKCKTTAAT